jgi:kinesin family protein 20
MSASPAASKPSGLLARGKAELRKVSDKMKEKEKEKDKEKERVRVKTTVAEPVAAETESLKVGWLHDAVERAGSLVD